jgi:hypothetical protein
LEKILHLNFYCDYYEVYNEDKNTYGRYKVNYNKDQKIKWWDDKYNFFIYLNNKRNNYFSIIKSGFTKGTAEEFKNFLETNENFTYYK